MSTLKDLKGFRIQQGGKLEVGLGKSFAITELSADPSTEVLIHINHCMPDGVKLKAGFEPLYGGFTTEDNSIFIAQSREDTLVLLEQGYEIAIFSFDGSVQVIEFTGSDPTVRTLGPEDAMERRLDRIQARLDDLQEEGLEPNMLIRAEDKLLHEIPQMLGMRHTNLPMRRRIMSYVDMMTRYVKIRSRVRRHFQEVLRSLDDPTYYWWLDPQKSDESSSATILDFSKEQAKRGPPASAISRKKARSGRDREDYEKKMGISGSGETKSSKSAGKKK